MARGPKTTAQERYRDKLGDTFMSMWRNLLAATNTEFTYDEVLELCAPPAARDIIRKANELAEGVRQPLPVFSLPLTQRVPGHRVVFAFQRSADKLRLIPIVCELQEAGLSVPLREKFDDWLNVRLELGRDYGRVFAVMQAIVDLLPLQSHQRLRWPAIRVLWQQDETLTKLTDKYDVYKPNLRALFLSPPLREAALLAEHTLTTFTTMPKMPNLERSVLVTLRGSRYPEEVNIACRDPLGFEFKSL